MAEPSVTPAADPSTGSGAPQSLTPDQATAKLEAMLGSSVAKPDDEKDKLEAPASSSAQDKPDEAPSVEPDAVPEQPSEEPETPDDEADEDNAEVEGQEILFTVQIDGKDVPVPISEARDGYMRRVDYTRKTQEHAQQVHAFEQHAQAVQQERQVYGVLISALEEQLQQSMPQEPNWAELEAHPDKSFYWAARARWDETQRRLGAIADEKDRLQQLQAMDVTTKLNEHLGYARQWLVEKLPEWRDEKRATSDKAKLREYAIQAGFTQYDVDHAYDPRLVILGHKARLYDELVANRPKPNGQGENSPEPLKPGVAMHQGATRSAQLTKAKRRLAQTGRVEDAEAAILLKLQH